MIVGLRGNDIADFRLRLMMRVIDAANISSRERDRVRDYTILELHGCDIQQKV